MNIYFACHVGKSYDTQLKINSIAKVVNDNFGDTAFLFAEEESAENKIVIFAIPRPISTESTVNSEFFSRLERLFTVLSDYSPHFTQESYYVD